MGSFIPNSILVNVFINKHSVCIKDLIGMHEYEPACIKHKKDQNLNKQLENLYFLSSYFAMKKK
jgi:hypothetical protein